MPPESRELRSACLCPLSIDHRLVLPRSLRTVVTMIVQAVRICRQMEKLKGEALQAIVLIYLCDDNAIGLNLD